MNKTLVCILIIINLFALSGQQCQKVLRGFVIDETTSIPQSFAHVQIQELGKGTIAAEDGSFEITGICPGSYHLFISHIGCETREINLNIKKDTSLIIKMNHHPFHFETVVVHGEEEVHNVQTTIGKLEIEDSFDKNLGDIMEKQTGVFTFKSASDVSKPIVHGLYGNRLNMLNHGVMQSGQRWGDDHAPEIDPSAAQKITIIKGPNQLEYLGNNAGALILIEPGKIKQEPHLHGRVGYSYETNGKGHNTNIQVQKHHPIVAWRFNGTFKKYGERRAPNYFLNNTGNELSALSLQLEKAIDNKIFLDGYFSHYQSNNGILRGAVIGNLTDLERAFNNNQPYFTNNSFSYKIGAPRQLAKHQFARLGFKYLKDNTEIRWIGGGQFNDRQEFDVRRGGRSNIPSLSIKQWTFTSDLKWTQYKGAHDLFKMGHQMSVIDNTNNPGTGILPLIPDYWLMRNGIFFTGEQEVGTFLLDYGIRYDHEIQNAVKIARDIQRTIVRDNNQFHLGNLALGLTYEIKNKHALTLNLSGNMRSPGIDELYSIGLHAGVGGLEYGDPNLKTEHSLKGSFNLNSRINKRLTLEVLTYFHRFNNYIYLNPTGETELTIRGAFPVFEYQQTDALIYGLDINASLEIHKSVILDMSYSGIRGDDLSEGIPLVYIPNSNTKATLLYRNNKTIKINQVKFNDFDFEWEYVYQMRQNNLLESQDFIPAPNAYQINNLKLSMNLIATKYKVRLNIKATNIFDVTYRNYLNRMRYYADDLGRSIVFGCMLKF